MVPEEKNYAELEARYAAAIRKQARRVWARKNFALLLAGSSLLVLTVLLLIGCMVFLPQSIHYVFADQKSCVSSPIIFPSLYKTDSHGTFTLSHEPTVSIGHTTIFSYRLCATAVRAPLSSTSYTNHQWLPIAGLHIGKSIRVVTADYPVAFAGSLGAKAVPIEKALSFTLKSPDATFNYAVVGNGQTAACSKLKSSLNCSLAPLKLAYATTYPVSLVRVFHGQATSTVFTKTVQTITATAITQASIGAGTTVYNSPQQITITTNKTITQLQAVSLTIKNADGSSTPVPTTNSFSGQTITVTITNPLPRKTLLDLHIANLTASDMSMLEQPYDLPFTTSGGPKVTNDNIPSFGLAAGQAMVVSFDQTLNPAQDPNQFAALLVNGAQQPASFTISGKQLIVHPTNSYPVCAAVTIQLSAAAQNAYGVAGDSAWSYTSRSHCYTTYSIGTSVQGRPITAYQFGSGPSMVLYIAAMEGNEQNSAELLQQWIPDIDANPAKIPSDRTIVVIPQINPDGFAANTRLNAAGIDLNRNFPANNWQTQVTEPLANTVWTDDGGPSPLSAPESQALASFYEAHHPRLTLTMHSHGGIVEANDAGDSDALGAQYASLADYRAIPTSAIGNFFDYTTTGAFEDWANDKLGLPVLEVELQSPTADEYTRNLPALWAMANVSP